MEKLISMVAYVLDQQNKSDSMGNSYWNCVNYANFLKQPLTLGMFVPCSKENGQPLSLYGIIDKGGLVLDVIEYEEYQEAKDRVLFQGFELENKGEFTTWIQKGNHSICFTDRGKININSQNERIVEDVIKYEFTLSETAKNQLL